MKIQIEHTDTYGGESNYSWVRRYEQDVTNTNQRALVRLAKKLTGLTGFRCRIENHGDMIVIWPSRICQVVFITFDY